MNAVLGDGVWVVYFLAKVAALFGTVFFVSLYIEYCEKSAHANKKHAMDDLAPDQLALIILIHIQY